LNVFQYFSNKRPGKQPAGVVRYSGGSAIGVTLKGMTPFLAFPEKS